MRQFIRQYLYRKIFQDHVHLFYNLLKQHPWLHPSGRSSFKHTRPSSMFYIFIYFLFLSVLGVGKLALTDFGRFPVEHALVITRPTCLQLVSCLHYSNISIAERCLVILFYVNLNVGILRRSVIRTRRS